MLSLTECNRNMCVIISYYLIIAGYVFDSVLAWAYAVNSTVEQGGAPDDGYKVRQLSIYVYNKGMW